MAWRGLMARLGGRGGVRMVQRPSATAATAATSTPRLAVAARGLSTNAVSEAQGGHRVDEALEDVPKEMREVVSRDESIRMSPWKINLLARQIRGLPVMEALMQLKFSRKQKGPPIVAQTIQNAANLASIRYNLNPEDLVVAEAFVNRANIQKGIMIHGRGRTGLKLRRYSHVVVRLKEIDFEAALVACKNRFQRARWEKRQKLADDVRRARSEEGGGGGGAA